MPVKKVSREEIIKKSIVVFRKQGFHKTTMSDLAEACGLLKGSFYYYFKSKDVLLEEVLAYLHEYYKERVFALAKDESLDAKERMLKIFKEQEPIITEDFTGCLFGNLTLETIATKVNFKKFLQAFFSDWMDAFTQIYSLNRIEEEARALAQQSVVEIEGALMMMRLYEEKSFLIDACQRALNRL